MDDAANLNLDAFEFVYDGPDVANGSMKVRDLLEAVGGLKSAFSMIAHERELGDGYDLRIRDIDHASVHLWFEAVAFAKTNPASATAIVAGAAVFLNAVTNITNGAYKVVTDLGLLIGAKKWLQGKRLATLPATFPSEGSVQIQTLDGILTLTKEQYELLLSQRIDKPLAKIVSPLSVKKIDTFEMRRSGQALARVNMEQKALSMFTGSERGLTELLPYRRRQPP